MGGWVVLSFACNSSPDRQETTTTDGRDTKGNAPAVVNRLSGSGTSGSTQTVTLTGCLQRGEQSNFILTTVNEPHRSVGTTTTDPTGDTVRREQLRSARNAYRLAPLGTVNLDDMVGKQVQVTGTIAERSDLPGSTGGAADPGKSAPPVSNSDLSKVDVTAVTMTAGACGADTK
jgi:hypothetical protein